MNLSLSLQKRERQYSMSTATDIEQYNLFQWLWTVDPNETKPIYSIGMRVHKIDSGMAVWDYRAPRETMRL